MKLFLLLLAVGANATTYFDVAPLVHKQKIEEVSDLQKYIRKNKLGSLDEFEMAALVKRMSQLLQTQRPRYVQWHPVLQYLQVESRVGGLRKPQLIMVSPESDVKKFSLSSRMQIAHMLEKIKQKSVVSIIQAFEMVPMP